MVKIIIIPVSVLLKHNMNINMNIILYFIKYICCSETSNLENLKIFSETSNGLSFAAETSNIDFEFFNLKFF